MAKKPVGDLGGMAISKAKAVEAVPFSTVAQPPPAAGSVKSLTVKLDAGLYEALRAYCFEQGRNSGTRLTHQQVMVEALKAFLDNPS
jgi:hypothetical protein